MLMHIVVIADKPDLQARLCRALTTPDTVVDTAKDLRGFETKLSRRVCDLVVLSRGLAGHDAAARVRSLRRRPEAPTVVVLTS